MKSRRQHKILELIRHQRIETQGELAGELRKCGFDVTQATVSRDIKELGLIKAPGENNEFYYALAGESRLPRSEKRIKRLFQDSVIGLDASENLIVIKTNPGGAQGVASAIDLAGWDEVIGTVGGDDTILVVVKPKKATKTVLKRFADLIGE
jgi:transcriptional regulator of arginine metabolism